jgi:acyl-CoA thioesterase-2
MTHTFADLMSCLDLTRTGSAPGEATFRGHCADLPLRRIFGGQVAAQALVAAGRTLPADGPEGTVDRLPHSLHAYFLRAGAPKQDVDFTVRITRDGGSYSNRHVEARQGDTVIFQLVASFAREQDGPEHRPSPPEVPAPGDLAGAPGHRGMRTDGNDFGSLEIRAVPDPGVPDGDADDGMARMYWRRAAGALPAADPLLHAAVLTFASDLGTVSAIVRRHRPRAGESRQHAYDGASLDHTIWFHRPIRADDWMLFTSSSPTASAGRGLMLGEVYDTAGVLVATIAQEGMVRTRRR